MKKLLLLELLDELSFSFLEYYDNESEVANYYGEE